MRVGKGLFLGFGAHDVAVPTVTGISPPKGTTDGGTALSISGTSFTGASGVTIGGTACTSVVVVSDILITCVSPAKAMGTYDVAVTAPGGTATLVSGYTEIVSPSAMLLWLRADMGITLNNTGTTVSQWNDQSGTGDANKDQVQPLPLPQPTRTAIDAGYNGQPTLSFDQTDDCFQAIGNWVSPVPAIATWFVVGETSATGDNFLLSDGTSGYEMYKQANGGDYRMNLIQGSDLFAGYSPEEAHKRIWCFECNGSSSNIYRDSLTASATGNSGGNTALSMSVVNQGGQLGGKIAEVIGYAGILSTPDRTKVMQYLSARYAETLV